VPYSRPKPSKRRQMYLALVGKLEAQLRDLYAKRSEEGYTLASAAERLGVNRSVVTRRLNGRANMTIETVAEMVWAGGGAIDLEIYDPGEMPPSNGPRAIHEPLSYEPEVSVIRMPARNVVTFSNKESIDA